MDKELAKQLLDKTKRDYNLIAEEFSRTRRNLWSELFAIFQDYIRDDDKILDVGCGNGRLLDLLEEKKIDYIGIDNSEEQIKEARKKYPDKNFLAADVLNLPFPENFFDRVFLIAVLHHIPGEELRQKTLREIQRVLRPEGFLLLSVWQPMFGEVFGPIFKYSFLKLIGRSKMDWGDVFIPWGKKTERYYHLFLKGELLDLVEGLGFKMIKTGIARNQTGKRANLYIIAEK